MKYLVYNYNGMDLETMQDVNDIQTRHKLIKYLVYYDGYKEDLQDVNNIQIQQKLMAYLAYNYVDIKGIYRM